MTVNEILKQNWGNQSPFRRLLGSAFLCSALVLASCGEKSSSSVNDSGFIQNSQSHLEAPSSSKSTKNLFGRSLKSDEERLDRVERALQDLRNDFDNVRPAIRRLMVIEGDMQSMVRELQKINNSPAQDPVVTSGATIAPSQRNPSPPPAPQRRRNAEDTSTQQRQAPATAQVNPPTQAKPAKAPQTRTAPPVQNGKASVFDVRTGEHPGKTRLVLDVNAKTNFNVDIDNSENIMIVELPQASWGAAQSKNFSRSPYLKSYSVENSGNGSLLILQLKKNAKVSYKKDLPALSGTGRRLVIDVSGN